MGVVAVTGDEITAGDVDRVHQVARAVAFAPDRDLLHAIPTDYRVDHQGGIKRALGMAATRLECDVYLITASATASANIRKAVSRAGYGVQELVLEPLASARAVLTEDEKEVGATMVGIGGCATDIAVYVDGRMRHVAVLPVGSDAVTADLVKGLGIPWAEAQKAKELYATAMAGMVDPQETVEMPGPGPGQVRNVARELIAHITEQRLDEILGLVRTDLDRLQLLDRLGAGIVLTGGGVALPGLVELAQQVFPTPVRLGVPGEGLSGLADSVGRPRFATAVGLAMHGLERFGETGEGASTFTSGVMSKVSAWLKEFF
ncbi:MAG TPA: cell division protein FtsA [Gemmatimonadetes bacterium]|nr:cell division protein FtsA [Gemmatimonadota bacterium]